MFTEHQGPWEGLGRGTQAWVRECWPQGGRRGERQTQIPISTVGLGWKAAQKREESLGLKDEGPWAARTRLANRSWFPPGEFTGLIVRLFCETPVEPHTTCSLILVLSVERWNKLNFSPARQPHQIAINRCKLSSPCPSSVTSPHSGTPSLGFPVQTCPPQDRTHRQTLALAWRPGRWLQVFSGCLAGCQGLPRPPARPPHPGAERHSEPCILGGPKDEAN